jgi:hypothetical protein
VWSVVNGPQNLPFLGVGFLISFEFSWEKVACRRNLLLFAELAAGAGARAYGVPSHAGGLPACKYKYWRTPGRRKMDECGNLADFRGWADR